MNARSAFPLLALVMAAGCGVSDVTANPAVQHPVGPSLSSSPRSGELLITKECSQYTRLAGGFCTITSSNIPQIEVGTRVVYTIASGPTVLDTDVTLDPPKPGESVAFGHCRLDLASGIGLCTFSGGTGKFRWFEGSANVARLVRPNWSWSGWYRFSPQE